MWVLVAIVGPVASHTIISLIVMIAYAGTYRYGHHQHAPDTA
jgi:hypothetical protein